MPGIAAAPLATTLRGGTVPATVCAGLAALAVGRRHSSVPAAAGAAVLCWGLADGFVLHRFGELHASGADGLALGAVLAAGLAGCAVAAVRAATVRRRGYAAGQARPGREPSPRGTAIGSRPAPDRRREPLRVPQPSEGSARCR